MSKAREFGQRVKEIRTDLKESQTVFGKSVGLSQGTVAEIERGDYEESKRTPAMAAHAGVNVKWLATGKGAKRSNDTQAADDTHVSIAKHAVKFKQGEGTDVFHAEISGTHKYQLSYFQKRRVNPDNCVVVIGDGHSMSPTIEDGDAVLVDTSQRTFLNNRIFAFEVDNKPRIKRINVKTNEEIDLISDNPDKQKYPTETYSREQLNKLKLIGRCISRSGDL